jgi:hypothetical protein
MLEIEIGVGIGARIAPGAGVQADGPHEGAKLHLLLCGHGAILFKSIAPVLRGAAIWIEVGMALRQSKGLWHLFLAAIIVGGKADAFDAKSFRCSVNRWRIA